MRELVEREAVAAAAALPSLDDAAVGPALLRAAQLLEERVGDVLAANERDVAAATLDEGGLDRLRLDEQRVATLARQLEAAAALEPLEREISSRTLTNGLQVRELRIPVGTIGANFEARPGVALDIAAQVLKSLNTIVLRTGGAALATVETLVDHVLRPALEAEGIDGGAVGLVRSADRSGAEALVSVPRWIPLVILRGSGASTAALARLAADNGVRTLAHAEGGGVLYVHGSARADRVTTPAWTGSGSATGSTSPSSTGKPPVSQPTSSRRARVAVSTSSVLLVPRPSCRSRSWTSRSGTSGPATRRGSPP